MKTALKSKEQTEEEWRDVAGLAADMLHAARQLSSNNIERGSRIAEAKEAVNDAKAEAERLAKEAKEEDERKAKEEKAEAERLAKEAERKAEREKAETLALKLSKAITESGSTQAIRVKALEVRLRNAQLAAGYNVSASGISQKRARKDDFWTAVGNDFENLLSSKLQTHRFNQLVTRIERTLVSDDAIQSSTDDLADVSAQLLAAMSSELPEESGWQKFIVPALTALVPEVHVWDTHAKQLEPAAGEHGNVSPDVTLTLKEAPLNWYSARFTIEGKSKKNSDAWAKIQFQAVQQMRQAQFVQADGKFGGLLQHGACMRGEKITLLRLAPTASKTLLYAQDLQFPHGKDSESEKMRIATVRKFRHFLRTPFEAPGGHVADLKFGPKLGSGATSSVYALVKPDSDNGSLAPFVIKVAHNEMCRADILSEMAVLELLRECNVPSTIRMDRCDEDGRWAVLGPALTPFVGRLGPRFATVSPAQVGQLVRALSGIHAAGFVHRDISPWNLGFASDGTAYVFDFGTAVEMTNGKYVGPYEGTTMTPSKAVRKARLAAPDVGAVSSTPADDFESLALAISAINHGCGPRITSGCNDVMRQVDNHWEALDDALSLPHVREAVTDEARIEVLVRLLSCDVTETADPAGKERHTPPKGDSP